jgi:uncharacterized protein (TIGR02145 family)
MKKNLLLMMMFAPIILSAQQTNGVTVSNLAVSVGSPTTVTFNVSWGNTNMPEVWSDTVWVFVDYNNAGKMERLLLLSGATLTETSAEGVGEVIEVSGNDKGVWVAGDARSAGSFSATVRLLTTVSSVGGACAYASNYPPVGEYLSATEISFTGTPEYEILLAHSGGGNVTVKSGDTFLLPCDHTLTSFTDATGAPGIVKCIAPANPTVINAPRSCPGIVTLSASSPGAIIEWYANAITTTPLHTGASYTTPEIETSTTSYAQARAGDCLSARIPVLATVITNGCCTAPGSTVTFTAFNPCSNAATGDYWYLTDTRESNNIQTYKVTKMPDGHIWMVRDLKFGDKCINKITFSGSDGNDQTGKVTTLTDKAYYGDCSNIRETSTPADRGYFYDWAAVLNKPGAYKGSTSAVGCSGTGSSASACQGICPVGWHVPTAGTYSEFNDLKTAFANTSKCVPASCNISMLESMPGGYLSTTGALMYTSYSVFNSSTMSGANQFIMAHLMPTYIESNHIDANTSKANPYRLRCVRNY